MSSHIPRTVLFRGVRWDGGWRGRYRKYRSVCQVEEGLVVSSGSGGPANEGYLTGAYRLSGA